MLPFVVTTTVFDTLIINYDDKTLVAKHMEAKPTYRENTVIIVFHRLNVLTYEI